MGKYVEGYLEKNSSELVGGGFCFELANFAAHPYDKERALAYLVALKREQRDWSYAENQVKQYLSSKGATGSTIDDQLVRVRELIKPWL